MHVVDYFSYRFLSVGDHYARSSDPFNIYARRVKRPGKPDDNGCWEGYQIGGWTVNAQKSFFLLDRYTAQEFSGVPLAQVVHSHRSFRRVCFMEGVPLDYAS